tara:strand:+ start:205 stop:609 length:405 start_codon:yes stop_codon:yes gene_type:complete
MRKNKLTIHKGIYVKKSNIHGWGVFTNLEINEQEIVEECVIPYQKIPHLSPLLRNYRFIFPNEKSKYYFIALGFGSIYNHSEDKANIEWEVNEKERIITFKAIKKININEELLFNYNYKTITNQIRTLLDNIIK